MRLTRYANSQGRRVNAHLTCVVTLASQEGEDDIDATLLKKKAKSVDKAQVEDKTEGVANGAG